MIENNYDKETYKKISLMLIFFTIALWIYMSYTVYYSVLSTFYSHPFLNNFIIRLQGNTPNPIIAMGLVLALFSSALLTFSPTKTIDENKKKNFAAMGVAGLFCFIGLPFGWPFDILISEGEARAEPVGFLGVFYV